MSSKAFTINPRMAWLSLLLLCALLMLPNLLWWWYDHSLPVLIEAMVVPAILLLAFFAVLGNVPWLGCLLLTPLALLAPMEAYFVAKYQHPTSAEVIATLVATNPNEAREYLGSAMLPLIAILFGSAALCLWCAWTCFRLRLQWRNSWRTWTLVIALVTPLAAAGVAAATARGTMQHRLRGVIKLGSTLTGTIALGYPFGVFQRVAAYRAEWNAMRADAAKLDAYRFGAHLISNEPRRQVYVLVIGESSRRDHWQLFGYPRATTPELSHITNLIPITHMVTSWPASIGAIPLVITRKPITDRSIAFDQASILRAMQESGYETFWISNQLAIGQFDSPIATYAFEAQHTVWLNHATWTAPDSYDGDLLQPLRDALNDSHRNLFIVLHMMGSHLQYDYRYPPAFKRFQPTLSDPTTQVPTGIRMQNSYDNTILYTDHVLAGIIDVLHHSDAITALWYESDHGEMLVTPTCDLGGHGIGTKYEYEVPALFWYSDAYATRFADRLTALRDNAGKRTLSANTFSSLIDMAGVAFPGHDETLSLLSPQWRYHPRLVNANMWITDYDKAPIGKKCPIVLPP